MFLLINIKQVKIHFENIEIINDVKKKDDEEEEKKKKIMLKNE